MSDVADEQGVLVVDAVGDRQEVHVGHRDPQAVGLRAGEPAAERARPQVPEVLAELRLPVPQNQQAPHAM